VLRCTDGGQDVIIGLFGDDAAADGAYRGLVASNTAVRSGAGDCARGTEWDHRYPGVGDPQGRVMCDRVGSTARVAWVDRSDRAVAVAERVDGNAFELYRSWARWVELPAFPTPQEQQLLDVMLEDTCERSPAGPLDGLAAVVAAVDCVPEGTGAGTVTYYRFADREALRRAYDADVARFAAPSGVPCRSEAGSGPGSAPHYRHGVAFGQLACGTDGTGKPALTWTDDALLIMGHTTGADRPALINWWLYNHGPDEQDSAKALNQQLTPPFPTPQEDELLQLIPAASRVNCVRPTSETVRSYVEDATVVAVACTTTNGPGTVLYFRYADAAALGAEVGPGGGPDCQSNPPGFSGAARYTRPDGSSGTLYCGTDEDGDGYIGWSDEQASILAVAYYGDPAQLIRWWQAEAGPN
jgi:hypothetical protein